MADYKINYKKLEDYLDKNGFNLVYTVLPNQLTKAEIFYRRSYPVTIHDKILSTGIGINIEEAKIFLLNKINDNTLYVKSRTDIDMQMTFYVPNFMEKKEEVEEDININTFIRNFVNSMIQLKNYRFTNIPKGVDEVSYHVGVLDMYADTLQLMFKDLEDLNFNEKNNKD